MIHFGIRLAATLAICFGLSFLIVELACTPTQTPASVARTTVLSADTAWTVAAQVCVSSTDATLRAKCTPPLIAAHTALLRAASAVDSGGTDYACDLAAFSAALSTVGSVVALPSGLVDTQALTAGLTCPPAAIADGGGQ